MGLARRAPLWSLLIAAAALDAAERVELTVAAVTGADWRVAGLTLSIELSGDGLAGELAVQEIALPGAGLSFADTRVRCGRLELSGAGMACRDALVSFALPGAERQAVPAELTYARHAATLDFVLRGVALAGGELDVRGSASPTAVRASLVATSLDLARLPPLVEPFVAGLAAFDPAGTADLRAAIDLRAGELARLDLSGGVYAASFSNEAGTIVAADADAALELHATRSGDGWAFEATLDGNAGEAYVEPVYMNFAETPLRFSVRGATAAGGRAAALDSLALALGSAVTVTGGLDVTFPGDDGPRVSGAIRLEDTDLDALYSGLLQVFAAGTLFGDLDAGGTVSGTVRLSDNAVGGVELYLDDVFLDDRAGRISVAGLEGELHWPGPDGEPADAPATVLAWDAASAYRVPFGAGSVRLRLGGNDVELLAPVRVPTMGGAVRIEQLAVTDFGEADASGVLDAALEPIQLGQLAAAFGWPAFSGTLSGRLPLMRYDGGVMTLGGSLTARAFDGDIEIANLRLEEPFGLAPRLAGDVRLRNLDLELVTNTLSFGLIQGRLSGDVTGLQLVGWRPVAMDLHLYTPPGDRSRKRISQRAVENLASVGGGGAAGALSSGFMKFFEVFAYEEIGLRCVLANGICEMSGAGPAGRDELGGGYYIVKGKGLPRIDVVGYQDRVSSASLVSQLENILASGTPVVR